MYYSIDNEGKFDSRVFALVRGLEKSKTYQRRRTTHNPTVRPSDKIIRLLPSSNIMPLLINATGLHRHNCQRMPIKAKRILQRTRRCTVLHLADIHLTLWSCVQHHRSTATYYCLKLRDRRGSLLKITLPGSKHKWMPTWRGFRRARNAVTTAPLTNSQQFRSITMSLATDHRDYKIRNINWRIS